MLSINLSASANGNVTALSPLINVYSLRAVGRYTNEPLNTTAITLYPDNRNSPTIVRPWDQGLGLSVAA